jgi:FkbM family methyltransferase
MSKIVLKGNFWFPKGDKECLPSVVEHYKDADVGIKYCSQKKVAIQAGGNCGIWASYLSGFFDMVYTFEPDITNFLCLNLNCTQPNVVRMQCALGNDNIPIGMNLVDGNIGAHHIGGKGAIPKVKIDDLNLHACDLLQLDIEGYEYFALLGAEKTIAKFHPVIMLEEKKHHRRYGITDNQMADFLHKMGYSAVDKIARDVIYAWKNG